MSFLRTYFECQLVNIRFFALHGELLGQIWQVVMQQPDRHKVWNTVFRDLCRRPLLSLLFLNGSGSVPSSAGGMLDTIGPAMMCGARALPSSLTCSFEPHMEGDGCDSWWSCDFSYSIAVTSSGFFVFDWSTRLWLEKPWQEMVKHGDYWEEDFFWLDDWPVAKGNQHSFFKAVVFYLHQE